MEMGKNLLVFSSSPPEHDISKKKNRHFFALHDIRK
jgi:hypothetical protein